MADRVLPGQKPCPFCGDEARLRAELERARAEEREQIARALEYEASVMPCDEDAAVTRGNAALVRANFSYAQAFDTGEEALGDG